MKRFVACVAACAALSLSAFCACSEKDEGNVLSHSFYAMDAVARLDAAEVDKADFNALCSEVGAFLSSAENSLSVARSNSSVCKFNQAAAGATVEIDQICYEVLTLAKEVYSETDGYFNPAVYYCEDIYGFAARPEGAGAMPYDRQGDTLSLPEEKYVTAFRELATHFAEVEISQLNGAYYATKPGYTAKIEGDEKEYSLSIDLGGIGKGWCVDKVNTMLAEAGIKYGFFNFGTSSIGVKERNGGDGSYTVSAGDPRGDGTFTSFKIKNANLSTSGDNRQYYEIEGTRYCHIISPETGRPIRTDVATVTIVGGSAGRADALTTALAAMGKERAAEFIDAHLSDCKVIMLVFEDGAGKVLTNAPDYFEIKNKNYVPINRLPD